MIRKYAAYPTWLFEIEEVRPGFFELCATEKNGQQIRRSGPQRERLIADCKEEIEAIEAQQTDAERPGDLKVHFDDPFVR